MTRIGQRDTTQTVNRQQVEQPGVYRPQSGKDGKTRPTSKFGGERYHKSATRAHDVKHAAINGTVGKGSLGRMQDVIRGQRDLSQRACLEEFKNSSYSIADAEKAVSVFGFLHTIQEAQEYIGLKILNGTESMLEEKGITQLPWDCHDCMRAFEKAGYTYDDALKAIEKFEFLHNPTQAMEYIGLKVVNNYESMLTEVGITRGRWDSHDELGAFARSGYSEADAKLALQKFDFLHSVEDAKEYIGLKVLNDNEGMLKEIGITRNNFDQHDLVAAFDNSEYTDADVRAALNTFNFLYSYDDAKEYIGLKIVNNYEAFLEENGITPGRWDSHDELDAFSKSGYSDADAHAALRAFSFLHNVRDAREYIGLKVLNGTEEILEEKGITRDKFDKHDMLQAYSDSGYTSADAKRALEHFDFLDSIADAKEYIGLKVINGTESILREAGIEPRLAHVTNPDALDAYKMSNEYNLADAQLLARFWGVSVIDAKQTIGSKILAGESKALSSTWKMASYELSGNDSDLKGYVKSDYSYADAEVLAKYWGVSIMDAKVSIGRKVSEGSHKALATTLQYAREAQNPSQDDSLRAFLKNDIYTYDDAELLGKYWGLPTPAAKIKAGSLLYRNEYNLLSLEFKAASHTPDPAAMTLVFEKSNYSYDDAAALARFWNISVDEAKMHIGNKIISGDERILNRVLQDAHRPD